MDMERMFGISSFEGVEWGCLVLCFVGWEVGRLVAREVGRVVGWLLSRVDVAT